MMTRIAFHPLAMILIATLAGRECRAAVEIEAAEKGFVVSDGDRLKFTFSYPKLMGSGGQEAAKLIEKTLTPTGADLKYEQGAEASLQINGDLLTFRFRNVPGSVKQIESQSLINFNFSSGGRWQAGNREPQPFPEEKPEKPHLFQGNTNTFTIFDFDGKSLNFTIPDHSYVQITDNREWNWKTFVVRFHSPYDVANPVLKIRVSDLPSEGTAAAAPSAPAKFQIDRFGQDAGKNWPGKIADEKELQADIAADEAYYAEFQPPDWDSYGGLPGSGEKLGLKKTGFFHVEKKGDRWFLVDPEGNAMFYKGISCFGRYNHTYIAGREKIYEWIPPVDGDNQTAYMKDGEDRSSFSFHDANVIRKYGRPIDGKEWIHRMIERVRRFGFNGQGAFTGWNEAFREAGFPHVATLPVSEWNKNRITYLPGSRYVMDPFDEKNRANYEANCAQSIAARADDPLLIGYYLQNEPLYEDIPRIVPSLKGKHACKRELVGMLEKKYVSIDRFNKAWEMRASSFEELADQGLPVSTAAAREDIKDFTGIFLDEYFKLMATIFRKYDPNHMLIGNRLQFGTINNEQLCRIMGKYVDAVSFNYYTYALDTAFLERVHQWTGGKPMILSEFYWNSPRDSGLPGGVKDVGSQEERGLAYRNYVEKAASLGFVVGIEWFQLVDQSRTGNWFSKYNGENGNCGLFSVADRPYKDMLKHMAVTNYQIYDVLMGDRPAFAYDNPRFQKNTAGDRIHKIHKANGPIAINGRTENWPGIPYEPIAASRIVQGADAEGFEAAYKTTWDDENLYLLIKVTDATPMKNEQTADRLWMGDGVELFIGHEQPKEGGPLLHSDRQILLGGGLVDEKPQWHAAKAAQQPEIQMVVLPDEGEGYIIQAAIPWSALGFTPKIGDTIRFDLAVDDSASGKARQSQLMWNGTEKNSSDRGGWGRAVFNQ